MLELLARVRALLRRDTQTKQSHFQKGNLRIDFNLRQVWWQDKQIELSVKEFAVLELFTLYPKRIFNSEELLEKFFPNTNTGNRIVRVYTHRLREKLDKDVVVFLVQLLQNESCARLRRRSKLAQ